jgi:hypothetical protein
MELSALKRWRLLLPGVFLYLLFVFFCRVTGWCELPMPTSFEDISHLLATVGLGAIYSVTGLRELANRAYHYDVNQNIVTCLKKPFEGKIQGLEKIGWKQIRPIFYDYVDHDESLKVQSSNIRFNGLLWTSFADLRVIAVFGIILFLGSVAGSHYFAQYRFDETRVIAPIVLLLFLFLASFRISRVLTERHKRLGNDQCEQIVGKYGADLKGQLIQVVALSLK